MSSQTRQYLIALPPEAGASGRQDFEEFAGWFDITILRSTQMFLRNLQKLEAPFVAYIAILTGIDILSGYRYGKGKLAHVFPRFVREYFPANYHAIAEIIYDCRKTVIHEFSPGARAILVHKSPEVHCALHEGRVLLCADTLAADFQAAAEKYFDQVRLDPALLARFRDRAARTAGGTMVQIIKIPLGDGLDPIILQRLP